MDATRELTFTPPTVVAADPRLHEKQAEHLLDALKAALETPGEHRVERQHRDHDAEADQVGDEPRGEHERTRQQDEESIDEFTAGLGHATLVVSAAGGRASDPASPASFSRAAK